MATPASANSPHRVLGLPPLRLRNRWSRREARSAVAIGLIAAFAVAADRGPGGVALGAVVVLALLATIGQHLLRCGSGRTPTAVSLRTPGDVALATAVVVTAGSVVAVLAALLLAAAAPSVVGNGNVAVRLLLVLFAIGPCFALGSRCGRWWAFSGALGLVPLMAFANLVDGQAASGVGFFVVVVVACALGLASGSLSRPQPAGTATRRKQRRSEAWTDAPLHPVRPDRRAAGGGG